MDNMKKLGIVLLGAVIVAAVVMTAGCINNPDVGVHKVNPVNNSTQNDSMPVLVITVEGDSSDINVNEKVKYIFPSKPSTQSWGENHIMNFAGSFPGAGSKWIHNSSEGLDVAGEFVSFELSKDHILYGSGYQIYTLSAKKPGVYNFTAYDDNPIRRQDNMPRFPDFVATLVVNDKEGDASNEPVYTLKFDGKVAPRPGDVAMITAAGNPTTGYQWVAGETDLKIVKEEYIQEEHEKGVVGVGGDYVWYVTADEPGVYSFKAEYKRPWEDYSNNPGFEFNIVFKNKN